MQVCIAIMHGNPVMLELREGVPYINDEPQPIKHLTEDDLVAFHEAVSAIPDDGDPGNVALVNAKRAAFIVECVSYLTHVLDHVHYDVMEYLGETDPQD